jgi:hypothetical protein
MLLRSLQLVDIEAHPKSCALRYALCNGMSRCPLLHHHAVVTNPVASADDRCENPAPLR